jgi:hypothetical protein
MCKREYYGFILFFIYFIANKISQNLGNVVLIIAFVYYLYLIIKLIMKNRNQK